MEDVMAGRGLSDDAMAALETGDPGTTGVLPDGTKILTNGSDVVIQRLKSRLAENGKVGQVAGYDPEKGRYYVSGVDGVEGSLALKATNLVQRLRVWYDGKACDVLDSDETTGLFTLQDALSSSKIESVAPTSLKFDTNTTVRVHGLQSETGKLMNGKYGKITEYDEGTGRYMIDFGTKQLKIKASNLVV